MNDLEFAKIKYQTNDYTFVIVRDARVIATGTRDGIGELLQVVAEQGDALNGASLADKIVGKAVAMVAIYAGITAIYTPLGSELAEQTLRAHSVPFQADTIVPRIQNKRSDGLCPMEQLTLDIDEPSAAVQALTEFVAQKRIPIVQNS
jgi:Domain of unknown function (DUF1893)